MVRSIAILALSLFAWVSVQAQNSDEIQLRAKLKAIVMLSHFSGQAVPVDLDPRFAMTLRVESATPSIDRFREGDIVTFAIHSPSLLFLETPKKGQTYEFLLSRTVENRKVRFCCLQLSRYSLQRPR